MACPLTNCMLPPVCCEALWKLRWRAAWCDRIFCPIPENGEKVPRFLSTHMVDRGVAQPESQKKLEYGFRFNVF